MNTLYTINYVILSAFLTLFTIEIGIAILSLTQYSNYKQKIRKYINPIWEVNGTFAIFYLVNFEATFPNLLPIVAVVYLIPALIAFLFFILRNAFMVFSEHIDVKKSEERYMKVYGISTLIVAVFVISILTSSLSGVGVNFYNSSINLPLMIFNPFNILILVSIMLIAFFIIVNYLKIEKFRILSILFIIAAFLLIILSMISYLNYLLPSITANFILILVSGLILLISVILSAIKSKSAAYVAIVWLFTSIIILGIIQYPYVLAGTQNATNYLTNSLSGTYVTLITLGCGSILILALLLFVYINYIKKKR